MTWCLAVVVAFTLCHACRGAKTTNAANTRFAVKLYKQLGASLDKNILFSPFSLHLALANVYYGARGATFKQMATTMNLYDIPGDINDKFHSFSSSIFNSSMPYTLLMASGLFAKKGLSFMEDYVNFTAKYYGTHLKNFDFAGDAVGSRRYINDWTAKETDNNIIDLIGADENIAYPGLVIVSAIYFTGNKWLMPFDVKRTIVAPFFVSESRKILTRMMTLKYRPFQYAECFRLNDARAIELPYADDTASMFVFMPIDIKGGMPVFLKRMRKLRIDDCITKMYSLDIDVVLPKFRLTEKMRLKGDLTSMGMIDLFDEKAASLRGVINSSLVVSEVFHHVYIDVNEGTPETTPYVVDERAAENSVVFPFRADHPFVFLIRQKSTGLFLFMGVFNSPEEEEGLVETTEEVTEPPVTEAPVTESPTTKAGSSSVRHAGKMYVCLVGLVTAYQLVLCRHMY